jgi:hypothetical protein
MGVVFIAFDTHLERRVALKVIAPEISGDRNFRTRFEREMRIAAQLEHPNIVPVYEAGEIDGLLFLSMRYIEGQDLRARVEQDGGLDAIAAECLARQLGAALDAAHERGLVHRDVKPANILLRESSGQPNLFYLSDFGLAREAESDSGLTNTGQWMGTIDYVAPEQLEGGLISARSDIYSMGCVLFEVLTGSVPFTGPVARKLFAHANQRLPSVRDAGGAYVEQIDAVLAKATAKDPAERFASAGDLGRAFAEALGGQAMTGGDRSVATGAARIGIQTGFDPARTVTSPPAPKPVAQGGRRPPGQATDPAEARTRVVAKRRRVPLVVLAIAVVVAAVAVVAVVLTGQQAHWPAAAARPASPAAHKPVEMQVTAPANNSVTTSRRVAVRGTVNPADATVEVQGHQAQVRSGVFVSYATLSGAKTTIDVIASARNAAPGSTRIVVQLQQQGVSSGPTGTGGSTPGMQSPAQSPASPSPSSGGGLPNVSTSQMATDITPVISQFYQYQIEGQYDAMKPLTSPRYQAATIDPNPAQWVQNQSTGTQYFTGAQDISVDVTAEDPADSSVTLYVTGLRFNKPGSACTMWQGVTWAQYVAGSWRYDPSSDATPSRRAYADANQSQLIGEGCLG